MPTEKTPERAAIFYAADGFDTSKRHVMGRQSAGDGFLRGYMRHSGDSRLVICGDPSAKPDFTRRYASHLPRTMQLDWVRPANFEALARTGALCLPDPGLSAAAWRRRSLGNRAYSLCGITHTTSSHGVLETFESYCIAPVQAWDALICTSRAAQRTVERVLAQTSDYLRSRVGTAPQVDVALPVIPLGIHTDEFATLPAVRKNLRESLKIGADDIAILFVGRLSAHAKANPVPMFQALELAARRTRKSIHLILAGWFPNKEYRIAFSEEVDHYAPSIRCHVVEAPDNNLRHAAYSASDIFVSLSDNIQETFGLAPVEAKSAGLPVVVSDWDGYRDTVRHGVDGFLVPTYTAPPGSGLDLARLYSTGGSYDNYVGRTAQFSAVDTTACADAITSLIEDDELRTRMGKAGLDDARARFDWSVVVPQYQELWAELAERRRTASEVAPRNDQAPARPAWDDPFRVFEHYPSMRWDDHAEIALGDNSEAIDSLITRPFARLAKPFLPYTHEMRKVVELLSSSEAVKNTKGILEHFDPQRRWLVRRSLLWLAKFGVINVHTGQHRRSDPSNI